MAGLRRQLALLHHVTAADHRDWHDRQTRLHRQHDAAALEFTDAAVAAARAFGKNDQRQPVRRQAARPAKNAGAIRMRAIDEHVSCALEMRTQHWKAAERFLRDDAQLKRNIPEQARDVVDALVIRDEDVGLAGYDAIETDHRDRKSTRLNSSHRT